MGSRRFDFKRFGLEFGRSALPLTTDASLLGGWASVAPGIRALDVGTGCGAIALMLAQRGASRVDAIDIHPGSILDARDNIGRSPWPAAINTFEADFMTWSPSSPYDLIVSNPPYFAESLQSPDSARAAARHAGALSPASLIARAPSMLVPGGRLAVVLPASMRALAVAECEIAGIHPCRITMVRQRPEREPSRLLLEAVRDSQPHCEVSQLTLYNEPGVPSPEFRALLSDFMLKF